MNKKIELKPCPFCGGNVSIALGGDDANAYYFVTRGLRENACKCRVFMEGEKLIRIPMRKNMEGEMKN